MGGNNRRVRGNGGRAVGPWDRTPGPIRSRGGGRVAKLLRDAKPDVGSLDPAMNMELDLGFDSLSRIELLALAEARLGVHIADQDAARIFTLGELVDAFEAAAATECAGSRTWNEMLTVPLQ